MNFLTAYSSRSDTDGLVTALLIIGAIVSIVILIWILLQISRQTRGIEEIYKLLYQMQLKGNLPARDEENQSSDKPSAYMQEMEEKEKQDNRSHEDRPMTKGEKIVFGIITVVAIITVIAVAIIQEIL